MDIGEEHKATLRSSRSRVGSIAIPHDHSGTKLTDLIKAGRKRVVLDLKNLVYISSAGFRALLLAGQLAEESQCALVLCSLSSEIQRLFDLGAFTDLFPIYSSREEGLMKLA
jgi:anti-sigma B factor antagonist